MVYLLKRGQSGSILLAAQDKRKLEEAEDVLSSLEHDTNPETVACQWRKMSGKIYRTPWS